MSWPREQHLADLDAVRLERLLVVPHERRLARPRPPPASRGWSAAAASRPSRAVPGGDGAGGHERDLAPVRDERGQIGGQRPDARRDRAPAPASVMRPLPTLTTTRRARRQRIGGAPIARSRRSAPRCRAPARAARARSRAEMAWNGQALGARRSRSTRQRARASVPGELGLVRGHDLRAARPAPPSSARSSSWMRPVVLHGIAARWPGSRSIRCTSSRVRSVWRRKRCPRPLPSAAPGISPGRSAMTKRPLLVHPDDAERRHERGERVVGDLRAWPPTAARPGWTCPRWGSRSTPTSARSLSSRWIHRSSPGPAQVGAARGAVGGGGEARVAAAAPGARGRPAAAGRARSDRRAARRCRGRTPRCRAAPAGSCRRRSLPCLLAPLPCWPRSAV